MTILLGRKSVAENAGCVLPGNPGAVIPDFDLKLLLIVFMASDMNGFVVPGLPGQPFGRIANEVDYNITRYLRIIVQNA